MPSRPTLHRVCDVLADWLRGPVTTDPGLNDEEWQAFLIAARVHGVGPRLAQLLNDKAWIPPEIEEWIERESDLNRQRIDRLRREGAEILRLAAERGIDVLPLKGLALAAYLPDLEFRPMADLDLLVRPEHGAALHQVLDELGYRHMVSKAKHDEYLPDSGRRVASREHEHPDNPRPVDVHQRCGESFARSRVDLTDEIWASASTAAICGVETGVPGVEAIWSHLVIHTAWQWWFGGGRMVQLLDLVDLLPLVPDPAAALAPIDPRIALLALGPTERLLPDRLPTGLVEDLARRSGPAATRLAADLDPVGSSHLTTRGRSRLLRVLRLHRGHPKSLARAGGYLFAPAIDEMLINHDRVPQGAARTLAYPGLWLWHVVNLIGRG